MKLQVDTGGALMDGEQGPDAGVLNLVDCSCRPI